MMTSREFCYWLQGFYEINGVTALNNEQSELIQKHLAMVFKHEIDKSYPDHMVLDKIHSESNYPGRPRC